MAWKKTSKNIWQNPTYRRSSIMKHSNGYSIYCHGNVRGPYKTLKTAKANAGPWIRQFRKA